MTGDSTAERAAHLYLVEKKRVFEIALLLGITPGAASNALRRAGIPSNNPARPRRTVNRSTIERQVGPGEDTPGPCFACGVRADLHAEFGCKRWRPR